MSTTAPPAYELHTPLGRPIPLLLDSPHSGTFYPEDFRANVPLALLRTAEDTHVDKLVASAVDVGAILLAANYPRAYIDCNRSAYDIDLAMLDQPWTLEAKPSDKARLGYGLIWRKLDSGEDIYDRKLSVAEVRSRIDRVHAPYWGALRKEAAYLRQKFGVLYHLNCHSMPARATYASHLARGTPHADIVLGDRDGSTCDPTFVELIAASFRKFGLTVKINDPYKGVEIVREIGHPQSNTHSVQVEVNRSLYMDEYTRERNEGFFQLQRAISEVLRSIAAFVNEKKLQT
ncbi:MAG: N-formylglutamate amidohydrolase [Casimicrobium sp.]